MENPAAHVKPADDIEHKLAEIKPEDFPLPSDQALLREWRGRVERLHVMQDFIRHPAVAEFVQIGLERIDTIDLLFKKDRDLLLNPNRLVERTALVVEREVHEMYLKFFDVNPDRELHDIEKAIDIHLKED